MAPPPPQPTDRPQLLQRLAAEPSYDLLVVGGGAMGLAVAMQAAWRGHSVLLLEARDFAAGTSSRTTKLIHGGVRYLAQGDLGLVRQALQERDHILHAAPHLATALPFIVPDYSLRRAVLHGSGLRLYDWLAGRHRLHHAQWLSAAKTLQALPALRASGLVGSTRYWDGQFDDARLALALARTAAREGALLLNHCAVTRWLHDDSKVVGALARDVETGRQYPVHARCVVNATGAWADSLRAQDAAASGHRCNPMLAISQGIHLVVDTDFLPGGQALLIPDTRDGRILFAIPWLGRLLLGTTDTAVQDAVAEPRPLGAEVDFVLGEVARYLRRPPTRRDVRSSWAGLRPLALAGKATADTPSISRRHALRVARSGLVTVVGGKWTTHRAVAQDVLALCTRRGLLPPGAHATDRPPDSPLVGAPTFAEARADTADLRAPPGLHAYGTEVSCVRALPGAEHWLAPGLSEAMVRYAARYEYARSTEDMLARRSRLLFLDAGMAQKLAPQVASILAQELNHDPLLAEFQALAASYQKTA